MRGEGALHLRAPEDVHHLLGGVGAGGVPLPAHDLALGGEAELGGQVVLGLGRRGVHLVLLGLAVAENGDRYNLDNVGMADSKTMYFYRQPATHKC